MSADVDMIATMQIRSGKGSDDRGLVVAGARKLLVWWCMKFGNPSAALLTTRVAHPGFLFLKIARAMPFF
jgi:hypothetical protein